jgi:hypothetical protein
LLDDKRRYQAWLRSRRAEVEAGRGLTPAVLSSSSSNNNSNAAAVSSNSSSAHLDGSGKKVL